MGPQSMPQKTAQNLALQALGWIARDPDRIGRFLAMAGAGPADLRAQAHEPEFLGFVLDFLLGDEEALVAFAGEHGIDPAAPMQARATLPGGDVPDWT